MAFSRAIYPGKFISGNKAIESMTGYSIAELQQSAVQTLAMPVDTVPAPGKLGEVANGQPQKFRTSTTRKDGALIEVELAYLPLIIDGQITGVHSRA